MSDAKMPTVIEIEDDKDDQIPKKDTQTTPQHERRPTGTPNIDPKKFPSLTGMLKRFTEAPPEVPSPNILRDSPNAKMSSPRKMISPIKQIQPELQVKEIVRNTTQKTISVIEDLGGLHNHPLSDYFKITSPAKVLKQSQLCLSGQNQIEASGPSGSGIKLVETEKEIIPDKEHFLSLSRNQIALQNHQTSQLNFQEHTFQQKQPDLIGSQYVSGSKKRDDELIEVQIEIDLDQKKNKDAEINLEEIKQVEENVVMERMSQVSMDVERNGSQIQDSAILNEQVFGQNKLYSKSMQKSKPLQNQEMEDQGLNDQPQSEPLHPFINGSFYGDITPDDHFSQNLSMPANPNEMQSDLQAVRQVIEEEPQQIQIEQSFSPVFSPKSKDQNRICQIQEQVLVQRQISMPEQVQKSNQGKIQDSFQISHPLQYVTQKMFSPPILQLSKPSGIQNQILQVEKVNEIPQLFNSQMNQKIVIRDIQKQNSIAFRDSNDQSKLPLQFRQMEANITLSPLQRASSQEIEIIKQRITMLLPDFGNKINDITKDEVLEIYDMIKKQMGIDLKISVPDNSYTLPQNISKQSDSVVPAQTQQIIVGQSNLHTQIPINIIPNQPNMNSIDKQKKIEIDLFTQLSNLKGLPVDELRNKIFNYFPQINHLFKDMSQEELLRMIDITLEELKTNELQRQALRPEVIKLAETSTIPQKSQQKQNSAYPQQIQKEATFQINQEIIRQECAGQNQRNCVNVQEIRIQHQSQKNTENNIRQEKQVNASLVGNIVEPNGFEQGTGEITEQKKSLANIQQKKVDILAQERIVEDETTVKDLREMRSQIITKASDLEHEVKVIGEKEVKQIYNTHQAFINKGESPAVSIKEIDERPPFPSPAKKLTNEEIITFCIQKFPQLENQIKDLKKQHIRQIYQNLLDKIGVHSPPAPVTDKPKTITKQPENSNKDSSSVLVGREPEHPQVEVPVQAVQIEKKKQVVSPEKEKEKTGNNLKRTYDMMIETNQKKPEVKPVEKIQEKKKKFSPEQIRSILIAKLPQLKPNIMSLNDAEIQKIFYESIQTGTPQQQKQQPKPTNTPLTRVEPKPKEVPKATVNHQKRTNQPVITQGTQSVMVHPKDKVHVFESIDESRKKKMRTVIVVHSEIDCSESEVEVFSKAQRTEDGRVVRKCQCDCCKKLDVNELMIRLGELLDKKKQ